MQTFLFHFNWEEKYQSSRGNAKKKKKKGTDIGPITHIMDPSELQSPHL